MAKEANLLVTFDPTHLESAKTEIANLLKKVKEEANVLKAEEGLAEVIVKDAKKAIKELAGIAKKDVAQFAHTFQWVPIEKWCKATVVDMKKNIKGFVKDIGKDEKWKMDLKTRRVKEKTDEIKLILKLTEVVDRQKVDLKNPEKTIKVEIIGNKAGLALLGKDELLNIAKLKEQAK